VEELHRFGELFAASEPLRNALSSPAVPPLKKRAVITRIAESLSLSRLVRNFLFVLTDHRRSDLIPEVVRSFETHLDEHLGILRAEVSSARELSQPQRGALSTELSKITGKTVRLQYSVDPALIGGLVTRIGSTVYDGSVRGQIEVLSRRLGAE
jgi:F-type H+-transporting ATPase subunit delta